MWRTCLDLTPDHLVFVCLFVCLSLSAYQTISALFSSHYHHSPVILLCTFFFAYSHFFQHVEPVASVPLTHCHIPEYSVISSITGNLKSHKKSAIFILSVHVFNLIKYCSEEGISLSSVL